MKLSSGMREGGGNNHHRYLRAGIHPQLSTERMTTLLHGNEVTFHPLESPPYRPSCWPDIDSCVRLEPAYNVQSTV